MHMDGTKLGFKNSTFDVVCSFETIEHIENYKGFLSEIQRVLKPEGLFIVSTPSKEIFSRYSNRPLDPFHVKEFSTAEFSNTLRQYFVDIVLYGQKFSLVSNIYSLFPGGFRLAVFVERKLLDRFRRKSLEPKANTGKLMLGKRYKDKIIPLKRRQLIKPGYFIAICKMSI